MCIKLSIIIAATFLPLGFEAQQTQSEAEKTEQQVPTTKHSLSGAWSLRSFVIDKQEAPQKAWAKHVSGLLIHHSEGFMAVSVDGWDDHDTGGNENRKKFSYAGRFEVEGGAVIHVVEHASDAARVGQRLRREAVLEEDLLTLVSSGPTETATLIWKRLP